MVKVKYEFLDEKKQHLHTGDGRPMEGTTSVIKEMYPPPLAWWAAGKALEEMGWKNPKKCSPQEVLDAAQKGQEALRAVLALSVEEYVEFLDRCYRCHDRAKNDGGKKGKDKHALIEQYIKTQMGVWNYPEEEGYFDDIKGFVEWAEREVDHFIWSEAHCFSPLLWVGGITDFGFVHKNSMTFIGDAKSGIYHNYFIQTGGYSKQIKDGDGLYDSKGNKILEAMQIDGYMLWDYNKNEARYLWGKEWVQKMEADFVHTVEMYRRRDVIGSLTVDKNATIHP